eukprot:TCALIF_07151-PA protein Name:"Similar to Selh Selenoprotein H (Mus musculus)" AED:0.46 eAED:0.53 QI:84/0/0.5/1/1/1/2/0/155
MPRATRSATATAKANQANGVVPQVSPPAKTKPQAIKTQGKALKAAPASKFLDLKETAQDHLKPLDTKHKLAKASEQIAALSSVQTWLPEGQDLATELNATLDGKKPPRGAFEIEITRDDGQKMTVWSGLKRGPPRREKFPEPSVLLEAVQKALDK